MAEELIFPDEALDTHLGILGRTGSGKTYTARGLVERLLDAGRQVVIIDPTGAWWGLRSHYKIPIFGGQHGDVDIDDQSGQLVADLILENKTSAIIDLSLLARESHAAMRRFMGRFIARMKDRDNGALWLVIDEADEFMPQTPVRGMERLFGDLKWIVRRGRVAGWRVMMITQRPQDIAKAMLTQIGTLVAHRLTAPQDRKAIEAWVEGNADDGEAKEVLKTLSTLKTGEAWVWSPDVDLLVRSMMPMIKSHDSGATPDADTGAIEQPKLTELPIEGLKRAILAQKEPEDAPKPQKNAPNVAQNAQIEQLYAEKAALEVQVNSLRTRLAECHTLVRRGWDSANKLADMLDMEVPAELAAMDGVAVPEIMPNTATHEDKIEQPRISIADPTQDHSDLSGAQRNMLRALAWWAMLGHQEPSRAQVAAICGWKVTSGHLKNVAGSLKTRGLIEYPRQGHLSLTDQGRLDAPQPDRNQSLVDTVRNTLTTPQQTIFNQLLRKSPDSRLNLANGAGWDPSSGHLKNVIGSLRTLQIVEYPQSGVVALADWINPEALVEA